MDIFIIYFHCKFVYLNNNTTKNHVVSLRMCRCHIYNVLMQTIENMKLITYMLGTQRETQIGCVPFVIRMRSIHV